MSQRIAAGTVFTEPSLALRRTLHRARHVDVAYGEVRFAAMLIRAGAADEAIEHLRRAQAIQGAEAPEDLMSAEIFELEGRVRGLRGEREAAEAALRRSRELREAQAPDSREVARSLRYLGEARLADAAAEALALFRQSAAILEGVVADSEERAEVQFAVARALRAVGAEDEAREAARTAARWWRALGDGLTPDATAAEAWCAASGAR